MNKKLIPILLAVLIVSVAFIFGNDDGDRAPQTNSKPVEYKAIEYGPALDRPLSTLNESFEGTTFPPAGWIKINPFAGSTGWYRVPGGTTPVPGFNGGTITVPTGGGTAVAFGNYITGNGSGGNTGPCEQWLITPQIANIQPNDSLTFWLRKFGNYIDSFSVKISTTTPTVAGMTTLVSNLGFSATDSGWVQYKYNIGNLVPSGSNIYIGFREHIGDVAIDGASFSLDLVSVFSTSIGINPISSETPAKYALSQNYPNPFNPTTVINFSLPKSGLVTLKVYDILGKEVSTLLNGVQTAGVYNYEFNASNLSSGVYFYKLQSGEFTAVKRMMLVK